MSEGIKTCAYCKCWGNSKYVDFVRKFEKQPDGKRKYITVCGECAEKIKKRRKPVNMFHKIDRLVSVCHDLTRNYATFFMEGGKEPDFRKYQENIQKELDTLCDEEKEVCMTN